MEKEYNLTIIFPVLNEKKNLEILIPQFSDELSKCVDNFEILVVDDNSNDGTHLLIDKLQSNNNHLSYFLRTKSKSLPMSIYEGSQIAKYQNVGWLDADGSMHIEALKKMINRHKDDKSTVIIGSRFADNGGYKGMSNPENRNPIKILLNLRHSNDTIIGMVLSNIFNKLLLKFFKTNVRDLTSGFIITRKDYLTKQIFENSIYGEYFIFLISKLKKEKINIIEIGYVCETRLFGESKTAPNFRVLFIRGVAYIKAAIKSRKELNEN